MTKDDWKVAKERCTLFSSCELECDGYKISLKEGRSKNRILIGIYVNGWCKGEWFSKENENCPEIKFYPLKETFLYKKKDREEFLKMGKKYKNPMWIESAKKRYVYGDMTAASFEQIKTHLIKTCKSIKLLD